MKYLQYCLILTIQVKQINTKTKECVTLSVSSLDEPSGLSYSEEERAIYIADTNNHRIVKCGMTESESRLTLTALEVLQLSVLLAIACHPHTAKQNFLLGRSSM